MLGDDVARQAASAEAAASDTKEALCVGLSYATRLAQINVYGAVQAMPWQGEPPWVGDRVRVIESGQKPFCVAVWGSPLGTVVSSAGNIVTVTGDDGLTYAYAYSNGGTMTAGFRVALDHAHRVVLFRISDEPPGSSYTVPDAPPASGANSATFYPIDSGNYRSGAFDSAYAEISSTRSAAYWYGAQIANTIPDSATVTRMEIRLVELWDNVPGTSTQMGTHTQATRGAEPTITGTVNVNNSGTYDISTYANSLKTGAALGIGFRKNTGWRRYDTAANSGSIYAEWTS